MQKYIQQLLIDIQQACLDVGPIHTLWEASEADPDNELELEDMSFVEQYIYGNPEPIGEITSIPPETLPPTEKLTESQRETLAIALTQLLDHCHFQLEFPDSYPMELRYAFIRNFWNTEQVLLSYGNNHIEFCDYDSENCPFPGYCTSCAEVEAQMIADQIHEGNVPEDWDFYANDLLPDNQTLNKSYGELPEKKDQTQSLEERFENLKRMIYPSHSDFEDEEMVADAEGIEDFELKLRPGLCLTCRILKQEDESDEENLHCELIRYLNRNSDPFDCDMFESM